MLISWVGLQGGMVGALYHAAELSLDGEEFGNHVSVGVERRPLLLAWEGDGLKERLSRYSWLKPAKCLVSGFPPFVSVPTRFTFKETEYSVT